MTAVRVSRVLERRRRGRTFLALTLICSFLPAGPLHPSLAAASTGSRELISTSSAGRQALRGGVTPAISDDGQVVAFRSDSIDLAPGLNGVAQVFRKELATGRVDLMSSSSSGDPADAVTGRSEEHTSE